MRPVWIQYVSWMKHATKRERHGEADTRLWKSWNAMLQRCYNRRCKSYRWYGKKGVRVCLAWRRYTAFRDWARANGYADDLTIDRRDGAKDYEPGNCRWVTQADNNRNKAVELVAAFGEAKSCGDWSADPRCPGLKEVTIRMRLKRGFTHELAITKPAKAYNRRA